MRHFQFALSVATFAATSHASPPVGVADEGHPKRVPIAAAAFEAEHRDWQKVADGVYQRIDAATGAISTASVGPLGFRHDLTNLRMRIAVARGELETLHAKEQSQRAAKEKELLALNGELRFMQNSLAKTASVFYQSPSCAYYFGTFRADFSKLALANGGNRGLVTADAQVGCESASWCTPSSELVHWTGGARSKALARNVAGTASDIDATPIIPVTELAIASSASTPPASDANCTLTASATINTTEFEGCWIYFNRAETRYCSHIP